MIKHIFTVIALCASFSLFAEGKVIVEMDGVTFTDEEFLAAVADQDLKYQEALSQDPELLNKLLKRLFLSRMVAEKHKAELFKDKHAKLALKLKEDRHIHEMLIKKQYYEKIKDIDFEKLAESEYIANQDKYKSAFTADFYHVLFLKDNNLGEDPKAKADAVLADIKSDKATIKEMAKKFKMPLAGVDDEGIVKQAPVASIMPKISTALKALKEGEISDVIETESGFHIVSLIKLNKPKSIEYHEPLKEHIIKNLEADLRGNIINSIKLPYDDLDKYTIHQEELDATFNKVLQSKKKK